MCARNKASKRCNKDAALAAAAAAGECVDRSRKRGELCRPGLRGLQADAVAVVLLVLGVVTLKEGDLRVALEGEDVRGDAAGEEEDGERTIGGQQVRVKTDRRGRASAARAAVQGKTRRAGVQRDEQCGRTGLESTDRG